MNSSENIKKEIFTLKNVSSEYVMFVHFLYFNLLACFSVRFVMLKVLKETQY